MSDDIEQSHPTALILTPALVDRLVAQMGAGAQDAAALGRFIRENMAEFAGPEGVAMPLIKCLLGVIKCPLSDADAGTLIGFLLSLDDVLEGVLEVHNAPIS